MHDEITNNTNEKSSASKTVKAPLWTAKSAILVSLLAYFVSQLIVAVPLIYFYINDGEAALDESFLNQPWVSLTLTGISASGLLGTLLLYFRYKKFSIKELGIKKPKLASFGWLVPAFFIYYITIVFALTLVSLFVPELDLAQEQQVGFANAAGWQLLLAFLGLIVIAPVAEEIVFRGFIYKGLKRRLTNNLIISLGGVISGLIWLFYSQEAAVVIALIFAVAVLINKPNSKLAPALITSALFGLVHLQWNVAIDTFILSFVLIWLVEKTGTIWASIVLHAFKNAVAFFFLFEISKYF